MKGMELSREYFDVYGRELIENQLFQYKKYIAAGLAGEGSECLGFDDEYSTDHDFGPSFCIWVPDDIFKRAGLAMQNAYDSLPESYKGYRRITSEQGGGRVGVMSLENFYLKFTGLNRAPRDNMEWVRIPERFLATVTNGEVFLDNLGTFSDIRRKLKEFYPQDVVKKKLAARCAVMAQSGQYNYGRSMRRGDSQAAYLACGEFVRNSMSAIYILNETYMPYYKWMFRGAQKFNVLRESVDMLREITMIPDTADNFNKKEALIESVCIEVAKELNQRGFTKSKETFLQAQGEELMRNIDDTRLKSMHIMADYN